MTINLSPSSLIRRMKSNIKTADRLFPHNNIYIIFHGLFPSGIFQNDKWSG